MANDKRSPACHVSTSAQSIVSRSGKRSISRNIHPHNIRSDWHRGPSRQHIPLGRRWRALHPGVRSHGFQLEDFHHWEWSSSSSDLVHYTYPADLLVAQTDSKNLSKEVKQGAHEVQKQLFLELLLASDSWGCNRHRYSWFDGHTWAQLLQLWVFKLVYFCSF